MELAGKVAVVTGASSGIGAATAQRLARAGMQVVAAARRRERLDELAAGDARIHPCVADVAEPDDVRALAAFTAETFGACHVLVNNAGINAGRRLRDAGDLDELARTIDVNLMGAARCMAELADLLRASAPARVINVGSVAGKVAAGMPGYGASKFGLVGLSEHARPRWLRDGVAVCQVNPGFVRTEGFPQRGLSGTPAERIIATADDVAGAIETVARSGQAERTVPRWYRAVVVLRHVAAPVWRLAGSRL